MKWWMQKGVWQFFELVCIGIIFLASLSSIQWIGNIRSLSLFLLIIIGSIGIGFVFVFMTSKRKNVASQDIKNIFIKIAQDEGIVLCFAVLITATLGSIIGSILVASDWGWFLGNPFLLFFQEIHLLPSIVSLAVFLVIIWFMSIFIKSKHMVWGVRFTAYSVVLIFVWFYPLYLSGHNLESLGDISKTGWTMSIVISVALIYGFHRLESEFLRTLWLIPWIYKGARQRGDQLVLKTIGVTRKKSHPKDELLDALDNYALAAWINPNAAEIHCRLGFVHKKLKHRQDAAGSFRTALRLDSALNKKLISEAALEFRKKKYRQTIFHYSISAELKALSIEAKFKLASAFQEISDYHQAESLYFDILKLNPGYDAVYAKLDELYTDMRECPRNSLNQLVQLCSKGERSASLLNIVAYRTLGDTEFQAIVPSEVYELGFGDNCQLIPMDKRHDAFELLARKKFEEGQFEDSIIYLKKLMMQQGTAWNFFRLAATQAKLKKFRSALQSLKKADSLNPKENLSYRIQKLQAKISAVKGSAKRAEQRLQQLWEENQTDGDVFFTLAIIKLKSKGYSEAQRLFAGLSPSERSAQHALGEVFSMFEKSDRWLENLSPVNFFEQRHFGSDITELDIDLKNNNSGILILKLLMVLLWSFRQILEGNYARVCKDLQSLSKKTSQLGRLSPVVRAILAEILNSFAYCLFNEDLNSHAHRVLQNVKLEDGEVWLLQNQAIIANKLGQTKTEIKLWEKILKRWDELVLEGGETYSEALRCLGRLKLAQLLMAQSTEEQKLIS